MKDYCPHDHEFTPENTYQYPDGRTRCRVCIRAAQRKYTKKNHQKRVVSESWLMCEYYTHACGLMAPVGSAHWLQTTDPSLKKWVRCPFHWSPRAMRFIIGRTAEGNALMEEAHAWAENHSYMRKLLVTLDGTCDDEEYLKNWRKVWE